MWLYSDNSIYLKTDWTMDLTVTERAAGFQLWENTLFFDFISLFYFLIVMQQGRTDFTSD